MFDGISTQYDLMNRIISGGIDIKWRKNVVALLLPQKPKKILDVATGTGDLAVALAQTHAAEIVGIDISEGMLDIGKKKVKKSQWDKKIIMEIGDSENIGYPANYFDAVTVAFGVRNFENLDKRAFRNPKGVTSWRGFNYFGNRSAPKISPASVLPLIHPFCHALDRLVFLKINLPINIYPTLQILFHLVRLSTIF